MDSERNLVNLFNFESQAFNQTQEANTSASRILESEDITFDNDMMVRSDNLGNGTPTTRQEASPDAVFFGCNTFKEKPTTELRGCVIEEMDSMSSTSSSFSAGTHAERIENQGDFSILRHPVLPDQTVENSAALIAEDSNASSESTSNFSGSNNSPIHDFLSSVEDNRPNADIAKARKQVTDSLDKLTKSMNFKVGVLLHGIDCVEDTCQTVGTSVDRLKSQLRKSVPSKRNIQDLEASISKLTDAIATVPTIVQDAASSVVSAQLASHKAWMSEQFALLEKTLRENHNYDGNVSNPGENRQGGKTIRSPSLPFGDESSDNEKIPVKRIKK